MRWLRRRVRARDESPQGPRFHLFGCRRREAYRALEEHGLTTAGQSVQHPCTASITSRGEVMTSTSDTKEQMQQTVSTAADEGKHVAAVVGEEAQNVAGQAKDQVRELMDETLGQVNEQSRTQLERLVGTLNGVSTDLESMALSADSGHRVPAHAAASGSRPRPQHPPRRARTVRRPGRRTSVRAPPSRAVPPRCPRHRRRGRSPGAGSEAGTQPRRHVFDDHRHPEGPRHSHARGRQRIGRPDV